ncbi:hypothetical protein BFW01_g12368 [Lasiodiplodia theobromae]|nr:hypothetical protein BFW01_g12368 [Lasiodiplodia theobromae]
MVRAKRSHRVKLHSRHDAEPLALKPDPHPGPSNTDDDTSTVRSYVPSSSRNSKSDDGRKSAAVSATRNLSSNLLTSVQRRKVRSGAKKRHDRLTKTQLDVLYPPNQRASIATLYRWMAEFSPQDRVQKAPYCFKRSDGRPRASFKREFQAYEARQIEAGRLSSPPDSQSPISAQRPPTPRSYSPSNAPVVLGRWKGKGRDPSDDGGRIRVLEERVQFLEAATQQALDKVAERQDRTVDQRIRSAVGPLREEQRRLNDALGEQIRELTASMSKQMGELTNAVMSGRFAGRQLGSPIKSSVA